MPTHTDRTARTAHDRTGPLSLTPSAAAGWPAHFPTHLIDLHVLPSGQRLLRRPVLPQDAAALAGLLDGLSPAARRQRFHGAVNLRGAQLQRLCQVDQRQHVAVVVSTEQGGGDQLLADARCTVDHDGLGAEFALLVHADWQRRGLGHWLLQALEQAAARNGQRWLQGSVLHDNRAMLTLAQRRGYACTPDPDDAALVRVQRRLQAPVLPLWPKGSASGLSPARWLVDRLQRWGRSLGGSAMVVGEPA